MSTNHSFQPPQRLLNLPPYLFAELDRLKSELLAQGKDVINLGVGDPDLPTPDFVIAALAQAARLVENHHYPAYAGTQELRREIVDFMQRRFAVTLDADKEVLVLMGSKDGIAHLPLAMINPGDAVLVPDPGYPVYSVATEFVGGKVIRLPLTKANGFLPDLAMLELACQQHTPKLLFINYPNNPTAAMADLDYFGKLVGLAQRYGFFICHDNAYSELYYDGKVSPSFLQVPGAKNVAIEMHSLSKSFNMTGWRVAFAVGHPALIAALAKIKTNMDSGVFQAVQVAAAEALRHGDGYLKQQRQTFQQRRDLVASILHDAGFQFKTPASTFYFWVDVPGGMKALEFCQRAIRQTAVVITPGSGFGQHGEGYFRFTITAPEARLQEAAQRLKTLLQG